jgi:hypothetical protein
MYVSLSRTWAPRGKQPKIKTKGNDMRNTPFKLAEDVKLDAKLIKDLGKKLNQVETEVRDAFKELEGGDEEG